ncbi:MAG: PEP/pyruvate-binding domain-containing protein [Pseudomonadota bacterium]
MVSDLVKAYRLFSRMMAYPDVVRLMRQIFLDSLEKAGKATRDSLRQEALAELERAGIPEADEVRIQEYMDVLTDLRFAVSFPDETIEGTINFARKQHQFSKLSLVLSQEDTSYGKIKKELLAFCSIPEGDILISPNEAEGARVGLISHLISNQLPFIGIAKQHITVRDVGELSERIIRTNRRSGRIGGKSAGMLLAHRILVPRLVKGDPELAAVVRIPESWYINTGIFSEFIDRNELYHFHAHKYKTREEIEKEYEHLADLFRHASFPEDVTEKFRKLLLETGEHPLVLRSSSLLEDNFGYAFSGKYDSVFLANQGDLDKRLREFIWGLKQVHMSTFGPAPILYRRKNNLLDFNEQMSVLVQKVVGRRFGRYFFPFAAGVAFSFSSYSWTPRINKEDGVMRLVLGLGTRAVNRIGEDYPRMVHLSNPLLRPEVTPDRIRKYSQKLMDVLDLETGTVVSMHYTDVLDGLDYPDLFFALSEDRDGQLSPPMFKGRSVDLNRSCITFDNLLRKTVLPRVMKKALRTLEAAYGRPVDVEFAWDGVSLYIVQCRTLSVARDDAVIMPEDIPEQDLFFRNNRIISGGAVKGVEHVVYVNPKAYAALPSVQARMEVARVISRINRKMDGKRYALIGPGRWGSSDINLGVKAGYEDVNNALVLGEVAFEQEGTTPEVSYGTHFFNDLVESGIVHVAIFPDDPDCFFRESFLLDSPNQLSTLIPESDALSGVIHMVHVPSCCSGRFLSVFQDSRKQKGAGFFEVPAWKGSDYPCSGS